MAWRMVLRRNPARSMTVVGDVAQTGSPAGATSWRDMLTPLVGSRWREERLTVNYRTPAEIMTVAADVLARFVRGQQEMDLDLVVSCWHDDVEVEHPLRPDRSWKGAETFREVTARRLTTLPNSTLIPCPLIFRDNAEQVSPMRPQGA